VTGDEMRAARKTLGAMWGLGRPLTFEEMGRVLRLGGVRPDQSVRRYENGKPAIGGPVALAMEALLSGWRPAALATILPELAEEAAVVPEPPKVKAKPTAPAGPKLAEPTGGRVALPVGPQPFVSRLKSGPKKR
jgi:hypothetical protein